MCRPTALILSSVLYLSHGQEVSCPASAAASCAAAAAAAANEGESLDLMQVAATAKRLGGIMGAKPLPAAKLASASGATELSAQEKYGGVWMCQTAYTGAKVVRFRGDDIIVHDSCSPYTAHLESDGLHITAPDYAAGTNCDVAEDGVMMCNNGDNCSKVDLPVEQLLAAEDAEKYVGSWVPADGAEGGFDVVNPDGEFFYRGRMDNTSGFLHLNEEGYWQSDSCFNNYLVGAMRLKLSKSGKNTMVSIYVPGAPDWSPTTIHERPDAGKKGFPFTVVAIPLIFLIFGVPGTLFFFGFEGKGAASAALEKEKNAIFIKEDIKYEDADSDAEAAADVDKPSA